jgi:putative transposase
MIDRDHGLGIAHQAKALGISRGSVYYQARPTSDADLALMRRWMSCTSSIPLRGAGC